MSALRYDLRTAREASGHAGGRPAAPALDGTPPGLARAPSAVYPPGTGLCHCLDHVLTGPLFALSLVFLAAMAGVLHRVEDGYVSRLEAVILLWTLVLLWPVFIAEALLRFVMRAGRLGWWHRIGLLLLQVAVPPTRIGFRSYADTRLVWFPGTGWAHVNKGLRKRVERAFSLPMIVIALMILPFLGLEYLWWHSVRRDWALALVIDVGTAVIWAAFALELIVTVSLARHKVQYCARQWIDVAVVLLPLLNFLPLLRLLRVGRLLSLEKLGQLGRMYRLRGLLMRAWRSVLALQVLQRLLNVSPDKRLGQLRELLAAREEELDELRQEIAELERRLAAPDAVSAAD